MKDSLPFTEERFVMGDSPANLRIGLDIKDNSANEWNHTEISSEVSTEEEISTNASSPTSFIYNNMSRLIH